jgi:hypothetical protein
MTKKPRFSRPAIGWTVTRLREIPQRFVPMRITKIDIARFLIRGGINGIGTMRFIDECYGRMANASDAYAWAERLNKILDEFEPKFAEVNEQARRLEEWRASIERTMNERIREITLHMPRQEGIADAYART